VRGEVEKGLASSQEEIKKLGDEVRQLEKEKYGLEKNAELYEKQIQELKEADNQHKSREKELEKEVSSLQTTVEDLKAQVQTKEFNIENLNKGLESLRVELQHELQEKDKEIQELKDSGANMEKDFMAVIEKASTLEKENAEKETKLQELHGEKESSSKASTETTSKLEKLQTDFTALETQRNELQTELTTVKSEKEQLDKLVESLNVKIKEAEHAVEGLTTETKTLNENLNTTKQKLKQQEMDLHNKENTLRGLEVENQELNGLLKIAKDEQHVKEAELAKKVKELDGLQEAMKMIDEIKHAKEEKVIFLQEEMEGYKMIIEEKGEEVGRLKDSVSRMVSENGRLFEEKSSLMKALEGLKDSTSSGNKTLINKYEEIIEMNKKSIEEKDRYANDLRRDVDNLKAQLATKERDFEGKGNEFKYTVEQLQQKNESLHREYQQTKIELNNKCESLSKDLSRYRPLTAIANNLVENFVALSEQDEDEALDKLKERVKELIIKESQFEMQIAENETLAMKVQEMNKVMELLKAQMDGLQEVMEKHLKFLSPESQQELSAVLSLGGSEVSERSKAQLSRRLLEDMEKNLIMEKRIEYEGQRWCIMANLNGNQKRYVIQREEEILTSALKNKITGIELVNVNAIGGGGGASTPGGSKLPEEVNYILQEIRRQEKSIQNILETLLLKGIESGSSRALQDLVAVNNHLLSRADVLIKKDSKDPELIRILQETEKENDKLREKTNNYQHEVQQLQERIHRLARPNLKKVKSDTPVHNLMTSGDLEGRERPRFGIDEEDKTISDIQGEEEDERSLSVQKSIGHLDDIMASPKSHVNSQTIKQLESKIEEMSMTQQRIVHENTGLKITVEASERAARENESLRVANSQYQIQYDQLVQELQERDNDEQRYSLQISVLKKELGDTQLLLKQAQSTQEKEHLKKILVKFLDNILK